MIIFQPLEILQFWILSAQNRWGTTLEWVLRILVGELIIHHTYFIAFSKNVVLGKGSVRISLKSPPGHYKETLTKTLGQIQLFKITTSYMWHNVYSPTRIRNTLPKLAKAKLFLTNFEMTIPNIAISLAIQKLCWDFTKNLAAYRRVLIHVAIFLLNGTVVPAVFFLYHQL